MRAMMAMAMALQKGRRPESKIQTATIHFRLFVPDNLMEQLTARARLVGLRPDLIRHDDPVSKLAVVTCFRPVTGVHSSMSSSAMISAACLCSASSTPYMCKLVEITKRRALVTPACE